MTAPCPALLLFATAAAGIALLASSCDPKGGPTPDCFPSEPPICGNPCVNTCGSQCRSCTTGAPDSCTDGVVYRCNGGTCLDVVEVCPDKDACIVSGCARSVNDCDAVRAAYESTLVPSMGGSVVAVVRSGAEGLAPGTYGPGCPSNCDVVAGDCDAGLDTCWLVGYRTSEMDRLAALYKRLGCPPISQCDCPPLKSTVACRGIQSSDPALPDIACVAEQ